MRHLMSKPLPAVLAIAALGASSASQAITFEQLTAAGTGSGVMFTPTQSDWVIAPGSTQASVINSAQGWLINLDESTFGASESGNQASSVYGAGIVLPSSEHGWRVNFSANLRTWDSYNDGSVVAPNPGASLGDWDLFVVNANTQGFHWDLTATSYSGGEGGGEGGGELPAFASAFTDLPLDVPQPPSVTNTGLIDPLVPVRPAGSVVTFINPTGNTYLPGSTWAWGGRDYAQGYFESVTTNGSILSAASGPTYVSFVLDSRTPQAADNNLPSWGQFAATGVFNEVPNGTPENPDNNGAPGYSFLNPLLPVDSSNGTFEFSEVLIGDTGLGIDDFLYIDPVVAVGYEFTLDGSTSFKEILLPMLGDADGYTIEVLTDAGWVKVGEVADGASFTFNEEGVDEFRVMGINPELNLDPANTVAFIAGLKFKGPGTASIDMTPITITTAVPEPSTWLMFAAGLGGVWVFRRRKA